MSITPSTSEKTLYPDDDGKPMSNNTKQFEWIVIIESGLEAVYKDDPNVFVAGDLLWYAVQGQPKIRQAPDAMVVFGRPKGHRGSYRQWEENNIAPQVVFEVLSPGNTTREMTRKLAFYQQYGVQEYYIYDPDNLTLEGWIRRGSHLVEITDMNGWVSPLLRVRFQLDLTDTDHELKLFGPDGQPFATYLELLEQREQARLEANQQRFRADQEQAQRQQAELQTEQERLRAEQERLRAERERLRAEQQRLRAERLLARLKAEGIELEQDE